VSEEGEDEHDAEAGQDAGTPADPEGTSVDETTDADPTEDVND
jgi:hypothetical protein